MKKTISTDTFYALQNEAKERLKDATYAHPTAIKHWEFIANGKMPFGYTVSDD